jgi:hypothetical protein
VGSTAGASIGLFKVVWVCTEEWVNALSAIDIGIIYNIFIIYVNLKIRRFSNPVSASYT